MEALCRNGCLTPIHQYWARSECHLVVYTHSVMVLNHDAAVKFLFDNTLFYNTFTCVRIAHILSLDVSDMDQYYSINSIHPFPHQNNEVLHLFNSVVELDSPLFTSHLHLL